MTTQDPVQRRDVRRIFEFVMVGVITPVVAVTVWWVTSIAEHARLQLEYVRIATGILQQQDSSGAQRPMREWAVAILNKLAPVKLTDSQVESLSSGSFTLPPLSSYGYDSGDYSGYGYAPKKSKSDSSPSPK